MRPYGCSRGDFRSCRCRTQPSQGRSEAFLPSDEDRDHRRALQPEVKDTGVTYRSPTGRGYSSNAELDFHVDSSDVVLLSCYNQAPVGGMSMCASAATAHAIVAAERPDYAATLTTPYPFSRNGEEAEDEAPWYATPICTVDDGRVFCKWNRNRIENAQKLEGVPPLTASQRQAMEYFDAVLRRPENMFCMHLAPGDLQILCNQAMLAIAYGDSRRLDRGPEGRVERPSLNDKRPIVERRSLRSARSLPRAKSRGRSGRDDGDRHTR
ncbi:MAG: hypothetical protein QOJ15_9033 [Bradyrhizobium sp.]|nr:hypothetical protein [Bradyrhizobium sp.]